MMRSYIFHADRYVPILLTALVATGPVSTDLYLPSLPGLANSFEALESQAQLTLSSFIFGMAIAQLAYGPLADRFGRRPILLIGLSIYAIASAISLFAPTIEILIAARFIQGAGGCAAPVLARAIVRDRWGLESAARIMSIMSSVAALAPAVGPIIGGVLETYFGWRGSFVAMLIYGLAGLLLTAMILPETIRHRDSEATRPSRMIRHYSTMLSYRRFVGCVLANGFAYGAIFSYISGSSFVLIQYVGLKPYQYSFCFSAAVIGYIIGATASARLSYRHDVFTVMRRGAVVTTIAATALLMTAWVLPVLDAYALRGISGAVAIVAPVAVIFVGLGLVLPNSQAAAIAPFPQQAGAASGLLGFLVLATAALIGAIIGQSHDGTAMPMVIGIALCAALLPLAVRLAASKRTEPQEALLGP